MPTKCIITFYACEYILNTYHFFNFRFNVEYILNFVKICNNMQVPHYLLTITARKD